MVCMPDGSEEEQEEEPEVKANTKNEKGNRKVVEVLYPRPAAAFKIPDGLDLEDESVVEEWWVKYGTLHILYVSGAEEHIEWEYDPETDFKRGEESIAIAPRATVVARRARARPPISTMAKSVLVVVEF
eukprot:COSAG02_NODE_14106_length_1310_cov_1.068538_1_plen_129_part_00